ncbi:hypothetical protein B9N43_02600 [Denitratisoma sp. DHT3]|uniref:cupin domain-containing protein n=1 Tax=Denitratisoma sp. DHT3 TaxID=1981880 RepID=UPI0011989613|nr:cupin domain-containing protein [Denitratisoma sp. DHT3]QDX80249.1 hypothetical protein B9N43_02600 [Denitratisoma sp. DHT3]
MKTTTFKKLCISALLATSALCHAGEPAANAPAPKTADLLTYDRLYTGKNGESHFDKVTVNFKVFQYANDVPPVWVESAGLRPAKAVQFMASPTGWDGRANHPPPRRQFFIVLTGAVAFTASDGETRTLRPGQVLLMEDHQGKGHGSYNADQGISTVVAIPLAD